MMKKLTPDQLVEFKRLRSLADSIACRLGVRRLEYIEFEKRMLKEIIRCTDSQKEFGERVLKELGLDFVKETYIFTPDGEIKILIAGTYQDVN